MTRNLNRIDHTVNRSMSKKKQRLLSPVAKNQYYVYRTKRGNRSIMDYILS